jgi:hypothetical protein
MAEASLQDRAFGYAFGRLSSNPNFAHEINKDVLRLLETDYRTKLPEEVVVAIEGIDLTLKGALGEVHRRVVDPNLNLGLNGQFAAFQIICEHRLEALETNNLNQMNELVIPGGN